MPQKTHINWRPFVRRILHFMDIWCSKNCVSVYKFEMCKCVCVHGDCWWCLVLVRWAIGRERKNVVTIFAAKNRNKFDLTTENYDDYFALANERLCTLKIHLRIYIYIHVTMQSLMMIWLIWRNITNIYKTRTIETGERGKRGERDDGKQGNIQHSGSHTGQSGSMYTH